MAGYRDISQEYSILLFKESLRFFRNTISLFNFNYGFVFRKEFYCIIAYLWGSELDWNKLLYARRILQTKTAQFVEAAKAFGVPSSTIIFKHIVPNALTPIVTFLPFILIGSISVLSALDFLGYGIPAPNPSWGELIGQGRERLSAWWLIAFPSFALFLTIQLAAFVGEGLRDAFDAKEKVTFK